MDAALEPSAGELARRQRDLRGRRHAVLWCPILVVLLGALSWGVLETEPQRTALILIMLWTAIFATVTCLLAWHATRPSVVARLNGLAEAPRPRLPLGATIAVGVILVAIRPVLSQVPNAAGLFYVGGLVAAGSALFLVVALLPSIR